MKTQGTKKEFLHKYELVDWDLEDIQIVVLMKTELEQRDE